MVFSPLEKIDSTPSLSRRPLIIMSFFMLAVLGAAMARLFELTVIHGRENRDRADQNRILIRPIHAPRGVILDRNGIPLTRNVPSIREVDFPGDDLGPVPVETAVRSYPFGPALAHAVGYIGEVSQQELNECQFQKTQNTRTKSPVGTHVPYRRAGDSENQKIGESDSDLSGVSDNLNFWSSEFSEFSESEKKCSLNPGDVVGKSGLEKQYDSFLRGADGADLIEVDANGKTLRTISTQSPIPGQDLTVNLDANLAVAAYTALSGKKGSAVAIDPADGSVLALVSNPSFDPNIFQNTQKTLKTGESDISGESETPDFRNSDSLTFRQSGSPVRDVSPNGTLRPSLSSILEILNDKVNLPLFNRAISGEYPPGSIFKLVTASAGLSENKIFASTLIEDIGEIRVGEFRYGNWYFDQYGRTEGAINIVRAIARSNDIFFYRVGERIGPQALADWAKKLGLGQKTGVDLPSEADGLISDPVWKQRQIGEKWYLGNTYHMAIGQGDVRVTPLQVAEMTAAVVTGKRCQPRVAKESRTLGKLREPDNQIIRISDSRKFRLSDFLNLRLSGTPSFLSVPKVFASEENNCEDAGVSENNRNLILEGMVGACSAGGTAFPFFEWNQGLTSQGATFISSTLPYPPAVACKTGTAQHGGKTTLPHAWIVVAGPIKGLATEGPTSQGSTLGEARVGPWDLDLESPKRIILVVLVEESGEGSYVAAPLAKQILTEWFK